MISAREAVAVEAGADVLARGGNAVDAAVTYAFVQGVVNPHDAGLGGFELLTMHQPGATSAPILERPRSPALGRRRPGQAPGRSFDSNRGGGALVHAGSDGMAIEG